MGLDMYLRATKYLSGYESTSDEAKELYHDLVKRLDMEEVVDQDSPYGAVEFCIGYWRKANAIHKWFVDHVQGGRDECQREYVDREQLEELRDTCQKVLEAGSKAEETLLPTTSGFFFGGTAYDDWYRQSLEHTIAVIDRALKLDDSWSFEYQSSW